MIKILFVGGSFFESGYAEECVEIVKHYLDSEDIMLRLSADMLYTFGNSGDLLLPSMTEAFKKNTFWASKETTFELAELGNLAGIYGAAKLVIS